MRRREFIALVGGATAWPRVAWAQRSSIPVVRLGLIRELLVKPGLIAFVADPNSTSSPQQVEEMQSAAKVLEQPLLVLHAGTERRSRKHLRPWRAKKSARCSMGLPRFIKSSVRS